MFVVCTFADLSDIACTFLILLPPLVPVPVMASNLFLLESLLDTVHLLELMAARLICPEGGGQASSK